MNGIVPEVSLLMDDPPPAPADTASLPAAAAPGAEVAVDPAAAPVLATDANAAPATPGAAPIAVSLRQSPRLKKPWSHPTFPLQPVADPAMDPAAVAQKAQLDAKLAADAQQHKIELAAKVKAEQASLCGSSISVARYFSAVRFCYVVVSL